ncbi:hypothetical protein V8B97DRAFT_1945110 [Scleroderma yunnanense]
MSLYTPVFPGQNSINSAISDTKNYADLLRDVHLFLATQGDILAPPSRPSSPNFEERVATLRENVRQAFVEAKGEPANGMWTQLTEQLKMGCVRGNADPAFVTDDQAIAEQAVEWILPETEQEWFEWEAKREASRLKKPSKSMQHGDIIQPAADRLEHTTSISAAPEQGVSPSTILRAKEKVKKWQATIVSDSTPDLERSQASSRVSGLIVKGKSPALPKGSSSLNFPVVKRAGGVGHSNKGIRPPIGHSTSNNRGVIGDMTATPIIPSPIDDNGNAELAPRSITSRKALPAAGAKQKIDDFPETLFLPPSFPSQLDTSTPPPRKEPRKPIRAKPPPILPLPPSSATSPPLTPSGPMYIQEETCPVIVSSSQAPHLGSPQGLKRHQTFPLDDPIDPLVTSTKEPTGPLIQHSRVDPGFTGEVVAAATAPDVDVDVPPALQSDECPGVSADLREGIGIGVGKNEMAVAESVSLAPAKGFITKENPSPTKSYFSSYASSPSLSPEPNRNLLLYSPESPVFSFAQNNAFRPPYTSTQDGPKQTLRPASGGVFEMGYSSQFDVEKHVDRVREMLEKDVDFDSWLRDVNTLDDAETSEVRPS